MKEKYAILNTLSGDVFKIKHKRDTQECIYSSKTQAEEIAESLMEDGYSVNIVSFKVKM